MEWEHAKSYILSFFVLLNIGLGILLVMEDGRYTVRGDQDRMIRTILNQNNISMYTMPMRRFPPMQPVNVTGFYYDTDAILAMFFDHPEAVVASAHFGGYGFEYGDSFLVISNGFIFFENPHGIYLPGVGDNFLEPYGITRALAIEMTDVFIDRLINTGGTNFVLDSSIIIDDGIRIIYRQNYRGQLIHSNFIEFLVTDVGIQEVEMQFGEVLGHTGTPTVIFSPDEALLTFVQRVRHITADTPKAIVRMDLVYFQEYVSDQPSIYQAVPFYRIFTQCSGDRPYLINAFTNEIID